MRRVSGRQELHAGAVEADLVEVRVVRVLALLAPGGGDVDDARLVVDALERGGHELALGDAVLQRAGGGVIEIEVPPAVALRPEDELRAVAGEAERLRLDIGVQPFLDERLDVARGGVGDADVEAMHVAAEAREVDLVGAVVQPLLRPRRRLRSARPATATASGTGDGALRLGRDADRLVLEPIGLDLEAALGFDVEDEDFGLRRVLLAGHRVAIRLERRAGIGERVDDPEVLDLAHVAADERELARVARPLHRHRRHARVLRVGVLALLLLLLVVLLLLLLLLLLLVLLVAAATAAARVAVEILAVGRQLDLDDGLVVRVLEGLGVVLRVHHEEVVVAREEDRLVVGRERRPAQRARLGLVVLEQRHPGRGHVVLEVERLVARRRRGSGAASATPALPAGLRLNALLQRVDTVFIVVAATLGRPLLRLLGRRLARLGRGDDGGGRHLEVELERGVLLDEADAAERQVLRVVGNARDGRERGRHLGVIEERHLGLLHRIDEEEAAAFARLVGVPEAVAGIEPARRHAGIEDQAVDLLRGPLRREVVVGCGGARRLRRHRRPILRPQRGDRDKDKGERADTSHESARRAWQPLAT